jgi:hypothetical protein
MRTKNNIIFEIGLFVKSSDGKKATCIECEQKSRPKVEFELPKSSTKALFVHLNSELHKDSDYAKKYEQMVMEFDGKGQTKISNIFKLNPSGMFQFNCFNCI